MWLPNYAFAWSILASAYLRDARYGWSSSRAESFKQAKKLALKSLEMDDSSSYIHDVLGNIYLLEKQYDEALAKYEKAVEVNPNDSYAYWYLGRGLLFTGQPDKAEPLLKKAMRLYPHYSWNFPYVLGRTYYHSGRYEEAIAIFEQILESCQEGRCNPKYPHIQLSQVYSELGRDEEARSHMQKVLEYDPRFNLEKRRKANPYKNPADNEREIEALRNAGAPEHPSSQ